MADIDAVIKKCVDDIWKDYGKKGSDSLSKDETRKFVMETLASMRDDETFTEADFEACFKEEVDSVARTLITKLNEIIKTGNDNPNTHLAEMTVTAIGESCLLN